jgi:hypothetical protein
MGDQVVHRTAGPGVIVEVDSKAGKVAVEFEDGTIKHYVLKLAVESGSLRLANEPAADAPPAAPLAPPASPSEPTVEVSTMPVTDKLLAEFDATLAARPKGAAKEFAAALGINPTSFHWWRRKGAIPDARRAAVRNWIDTQIGREVQWNGKPLSDVASTPRTRVAKQAKPKAAVKAPELQPTTSDLLRNMAVAVGMTVQQGWIIEDGKLVERSMVIL